MQWIKIDKSNTSIPEVGSYTDWKGILAEEGSHQCVYCCIHESAFGGIRNYHVEHYRPKSRDEFKHLENDFFNLFYACSICNVFKSDDWPAEPALDHSIAAYPCPSDCDYNDIIVCRDGFIEGLFPASSYMIERLFLNRPQLVILRKENLLKSRLEDAHESISLILNTFNSLDINDEGILLLKELAKISTDFSQLQLDLSRVRPYTEVDVRRKNSRKSRRKY